jgi:hypothetical protein
MFGSSFSVFKPNAPMRVSMVLPRPSSKARAGVSERGAMISADRAKPLEIA